MLCEWRKQNRPHVVICAPNVIDMVGDARDENGIPSLGSGKSACEITRCCFSDDVYKNMKQNTYVSTTMGCSIARSDRLQLFIDTYMNYVSYV